MANHRQLLAVQYPNWDKNGQRLADCAIGFGKNAIEGRNGSSSSPRTRSSQELVMNSCKTIDGRGASVHITNGPCITVHCLTNIIIHGINIHDCKRSVNANIWPSQGMLRGGLSQMEMVSQFFASSRVSVPLLSVQLP
ncbi:pectate lyase-like protein [Cinnamomum micranthum f. kanehirae]|uniref:Pectate lyase-like protein n=1 Tax=Cinnamomum micranthum f. kanehirae TaxID=337451 RepID=A0A443Q378_9MAGN|nr:pectate lyase-like protein [Cinnamomum micranthum f. kanehirae]